MDDQSNYGVSTNTGGKDQLGKHPDTNWQSHLDQVVTGDFKVAMYRYVDQHNDKSWWLNQGSMV